MRIQSIAATFPSKVVSNENILDLIRQHSTEFVGDLEHTLKLVNRQLKGSGSNTRRWLAEGETSLQLTLDACKKAMAGLGKGDKIDLLIVGSVYAELIEPSTASLLAAELGLHHVECVDMKEACSGFMKAAKFASMFIESGNYKRVMVVNPEFVMTPGFGIYPELFNLPSAEVLEYRLPSFTLGEGVSAVILEADSSNQWQFTQKTRNDLYDFCSITSPWNNHGFVDSDRVAKNGAGKFTSYGAKLKGEGFPLAVDLFKISGIRPEDVDALFTHSSSKRDWSEGAEIIGLSDKLFDMYATHGNVVSAAVPAAMALAIEQGKLKRGQNVAAWVASAGMSFSTAYFVF